MGKYEQNKKSEMETAPKGVSYYRERIIEEVREIYSLWVLEQILMTIENIKK